jgi:hypothetical protein
MAYSFGGGVNASLGAVDYGSFQQGAQMGAQSRLKGGQAIGQGIAALGQTAAGAIEKYQEQKKEKELIQTSTERISDILKKNPQLGQQIGISDPEDKGAIKAAMKALGGGDVGKGVQAAEMLVQGALQQQQGQAQVGDAVRRFLEGDEAAAAAIPSDVLNALTNARRLDDERRAGPPDGRTSIQKDYDLARTEGYKGSFMEFQRDLSEAKRPVTNITVPGANALMTAVGKAEGEKITSIVEDAGKAEQAIEKLDRVMDILDEGNINTGIGASIFTDIDRLRSKFLADVKAGARVTNDQVIDAFLGSDVFPLIGELGIGARGIDTPAERDFLISVFTGKRELNVEAIKRMTQYRREAAERRINTYNKELESGRLDPLFEISPSLKKEPKAIPQRGGTPLPAGVSRTEWENMTPEERKLFQ